MTDIVTRADGFRLGADPTPDDVNEANWLIDRLTAEVERLRAALTPFAFMGEETDTTQDAWEIRYRDRFCDWIDFGDIETARAALTQEGEG